MKNKTDKIINTLEPQMRLYGFLGISLDIFFDTEEELNYWLEESNIESGTKCIIDYLGSFDCMDDVISVSYEDGSKKLYSACDKEGYFIYDLVNDEKDVWQYESGKIDGMYAAFKDRGILLQNDVYAKKEKKYKLC